MPGWTGGRHGAGSRDARFKRLAGAAFELLLLGLAVDAEFGDRPRLQALDSDVLAAVDAVAVLAILDLLECGVDLGEQALLAFAKAACELECHLRGRSIDLIGKVVGIHVNVARERTLRISLQLVSLGEKNFLETLEIALVQDGLLVGAGVDDP
jgi:hypothetical protein